jgi:phosphoglycolate phosphatase/pyrophosphatase PpaX
VSDAELKATFGPSEEHTIRVFLPDRYDEGVALYHKQYAALHGMCPEPFEGIRELLAFLRRKGVILGVVTGKGAKSADMTFEKYGLAGYFSDVETGTPEQANKAPGIRRIVERHGLRPEEVVYVGDAPSDISFAREAGVGVIAVAYASTTDAGELAAMKPDELFHSVGAMRAYFEKIFA